MNKEQIKVITEREIKMKKLLHKKKYIIVFLIITVVLILANIVYASYINNISVKYNTTSGEMICNIDIDKNDSYIINGIPYVIVTVKNYDEDNNITSVDVDYSLTIKNKDGYNGTYIWQKINDVDDTKYDEGTKSYSEQVITKTYSLGNKNKEDEKFKIFIKSSLESYENLDFNIELNSIQKNMQ